MQRIQHESRVASPGNIMQWVKIEFSVCLFLLLCPCLVEKGVRFIIDTVSLACSNVAEEYVVFRVTRIAWPKLGLCFPIVRCDLNPPSSVLDAKAAICYLAQPFIIPFYDASIYQLVGSACSC